MPILDPIAWSTYVAPEPTSNPRMLDPQPLNSPSFSNIYPGDEGMADVASAGFQGVETTLQPLYSPSFSNIYPSIVITPPEDEAPGMAHLASTGFQGVKTTLHNSPSLSNIFPSIVITPTEDEAPGMADLDSAGFQGVKTTLQLVESVASVFPPLKPTVSGLIGIIDIMEVRNFHLNIVIVIMLTVPRHPLIIKKTAMIWSRG